MSTGEEDSRSMVQRMQDALREKFTANTPQASSTPITEISRGILTKMREVFDVSKRCNSALAALYSRISNRCARVRRLTLFGNKHEYSSLDDENFPFAFRSGIEEVEEEETSFLDTAVRLSTGQIHHGSEYFNLIGSYRAHVDAKTFKILKLMGPYTPDSGKGFASQLSRNYNSQAH